MPRESEGPSLIVTPLRAGVVAGEAIALDVLVRVQAPDRPPAQRGERAPLHLALVIDRSGSMAGRPLDEAKRCAIEVVERLTPRDRVAVIAYDHHVEIVQSVAPGGDASHTRAAIAALHTGGNTALHAGWVAGAQQLLPYVRADVLSRVLLLSDGQANEGVTDPAVIAAEAAEVAALGVTTSTYGLGHQFNEDLMTAMARAGEGNARYGETVDDLREPFATELALLEALWAKRVTLSAAPARGVEVELRNTYRALAPLSWRLPSVGYGAEAWALLRVQAPAAAGAEVELLRVTVTYEDMAGQSFELQVPPLRVPVLTPAAWAALRVDELVERRATELEAARLQREANEAARAGDWPRVDEMLGLARHLVARHPWLTALVAELERIARQRDTLRFRKEALYQSFVTDQRLAAKREALGLAEDAEQPAWLRRKLRQGKREF